MCWLSTFNEYYMTKVNTKICLSGMHFSLWIDPLTIVNQSFLIFVTASLSFFYEIF